MAHIWIPPIDPSRKEAYIQKIHNISSALNENLEKFQYPGILCGKAGCAQFLFYYSRVFNDEFAARRAMKLLEESIGEVNLENPRHLGICEGLAGIKTSIFNLIDDGFIDSDRNVLSEYDPILFAALKNEMHLGDFDFLYGGLGKAVCFLEGGSNNESYVAEFIELLNACKREEEDGSIKWESLIDWEKDKRGYDFGMAHGMASLIVYLAKLYHIGICKVKAKYLLDGCIKYIFKNRMKENGLAYFPSTIDLSNQISGGRLAWCYGDLSLGTALLQVSRYVGDRNLETTVIDILIKTSSRDVVNSGVADGGLCHGAAGAAHIYNRLFNYTGINEFKVQSSYWFEKTLEIGIFKDGPAGYKHREADNWRISYDVLSGISGIGLALISGVFPIPPNWDKCLMLS